MTNTKQVGFSLQSSKEELHKMLLGGFALFLFLISVRLS